MKNLKKTILISLAASALLLSSCGGAPASNAPASANSSAAAALSVKSVTFYTDEAKGAAGSAVTEFATTDNPLFAKVELSRLETGAKFKVVWIANDNGKDVVIVEKNLDALVANIIETNVKLPRDWPVGEYRLDVYNGETLIKSAPFKIVAK